MVDVEAVSGAFAASETRGDEPVVVAAAGKGGSENGQVAVVDAAVAVGDEKSTLREGVRDAHVSGEEPVEILTLAKRQPRAQAPTTAVGCGGVFLRNLPRRRCHDWGRGVMQESRFCHQRIRRTRHLGALN